MGYLNNDGLAYFWQNAKLYIGNGSGISMISAVLPSSGWDENQQQMIDVPGVLSDESKQLIIPVPFKAEAEQYYDAGVRCIDQLAGQLKFSAETVPESDLQVFVVIVNVYAGGDEDDAVYEWWSPSMTSNNTPVPFVASASNPLNISRLNPYLAFDNNVKVVDDYYHSTNQLGWLQFDFGETVKVKGWQMYPAYDAQNTQYLCIPKNFVIEGSRNSSDWDVIYTADPNLDYDPSTFTYRVCMFDSIANYRYYRIRTTGVNYQGNNYMLIGNIQFYRPIQSEVT